jgi:hypothetical protein
MELKLWFDESFSWAHIILSLKVLFVYSKKLFKIISKQNTRSIVLKVNNNFKRKHNVA